MCIRDRVWVAQRAFTDYEQIEIAVSAGLASRYGASYIRTGLAFAKFLGFFQFSLQFSDSLGGLPASFFQQLSHAFPPSGKLWRRFQPVPQHHLEHDAYDCSSVGGREVVLIFRPQRLEPQLSQQKRFLRRSKASD